MATMCKTAAAAGVAMLLTMTAAVAQGTMTSESFMALDLDQSSHVDAIEFGVVMGYAFADADKNGDGKLSAAEIASLGLPPEADANGDGTVELDEFLAIVRKDFMAADRDGNGALHP